MHALYWGFFRRLEISRSLEKLTQRIVLIGIWHLLILDEIPDGWVGKLMGDQIGGRWGSARAEVNPSVGVTVGTRHMQKKESRGGSLATTGNNWQAGASTGIICAICTSTSTGTSTGTSIVKQRGRRGFSWPQPM